MKKDLTCAWQEWHETCELDKCSEQNIADLCERSNSMFARAISIMPDGVSTLLQIPQCDTDNPATQKYIQRYTFHLMEGYCLPVESKEERQQFKDDIFAKAEEPGMVTGYFLRDFFRSFVKCKENISYNAPSRPEGNTDDEWEEKMVSQQAELSPWFTPMVSSEDKSDLGEIENRTQKYWHTLNEPEKAALYAYLNNITMSTPELLEKVGYGKSVFSNLPQKLIENLNRDLSVHITDERDRIDYLKTFLRVLSNRFEQWERESNLGLWISEHFPYSEYGKKRRFSANMSGNKNS